GHTLADLHGGHGGANLDHVARDVTAGPEGQGRLERRDALAHEEIEVIQRARLHADEHLVRRDLRIGDVVVPELVGTAELVEREGLHLSKPFMFAVGAPSRPTVGPSLVEVLYD